MYAEIAINVPVKRSFHYHVPAPLQAQVMLGQLVQVAFGTGMQYGVIVALHDDAPTEQTKPIQQIMDPQPVVSSFQIAIAYWISDAYFMPIGLCLWLFIPSGLTGKRDTLVTLMHLPAEEVSPTAAHLIALLERRGPLRGSQINQALAGEDWRSALDSLLDQGLVQQENVLTPPRVRPRMVRTAALAIAPDQIMQVARRLGRSSKQADLLEVIAAAGDDGLNVARALTLAETTRPTLKALEKTGFILFPDADPQIVALAIPPEAVDEALISLRKGEKHLHILRVLSRENGPLELSWLYAQSDAKLTDLKSLEEAGLIHLSEVESWRDSVSKHAFVPSAAPPLTPEQQAVWDIIAEQMNTWQWSQEPAQTRNNAFLLHGVTGSGKTEIYLRAIELALAQGRQAIFLVPEIALTAQTIRRVAARFPGQVGIIHATVSEGERYDTWRRAREGQLQIVVGARSALFTPFPDVGVIILDEEHDHSYKQGPGFAQPYYHARRVAEEMMRRNQGVLILGSATPDLESAFRAERGELVRLHLPSRIMGHRTRILELSEQEGVSARYYPASAEDAVMIDLPPVQVVDMRDELKRGNRSIFSAVLKTRLAEVLAQKEQAILLLNRRGMNTYVFCRDCGYVDLCPRCDVPITYHVYDEMMRCHLCGYRKKAPQYCPQCDSPRIKFFGAGTQQVEQELAQLFPQAKVTRWDADTTRSASSHEELLQRFVDREADVLVGTQMVAKGLDLPLVTLVGVVSADMGLNLPDFHAAERTFQLLTQVAGRAGRGLLGGQAILQTYQPEHYAVQAAATHDYAGFYAQEIANRRELGYPPLRRMIRIVFQHQKAARVQAEAERAADLLRQQITTLNLNTTEIIGPAPCFFARINYIYRWHLLLRGPDPVKLLGAVQPGRNWYIDVDPVDVL